MLANELSTGSGVTSCAGAWSHSCTEIGLDEELTSCSDLRSLYDLMIFVNVDDDTRLARRVRRDITERGRDVLQVLDQYERTVKPSFTQFILPTKQYAHIIVSLKSASYELRFPGSACSDHCECMKLCSRLACMKGSI